MRPSTFFSAAAGAGKVKSMFFSLLHFLFSCVDDSRKRERRERIKEKEKEREKKVNVIEFRLCICTLFFRNGLGVEKSCTDQRKKMESVFWRVNQRHFAAASVQIFSSVFKERDVLHGDDFTVCSFSRYVKN